MKMFSRFACHRKIQKLKRLELWLAGGGRMKILVWAKSQMCCRQPTCLYGKTTNAKCLTRTWWRQTRFQKLYSALVQKMGVLTAAGQTQVMFWRVDKKTLYQFRYLGGPLIDKKTGNLIGIVSTGVGCARKGLPGIYTRVSRYVKWIKKSVGQWRSGKKIRWKNEFYIQISFKIARTVFITKKIFLKI